MEEGKNEYRLQTRRFIDPQGQDLTQWITDKYKEKLFYKICLSIMDLWDENGHPKALKDSYKEVADIVNWTRELKGEGPKVVIQGKSKS